MRRLRRVALAVVAALIFSSTAYAFNPLNLLPFAFPFKTTQKKSTPAAASSPKAKPDIVAGRGYDARSSSGATMGTRAPTGYNPTKTRFWQ
jgi:hypothetical protein